MYPCELDGYVKPIRCARLYRVGEPDYSMTRARFLTLAEIFRGVRVFFLLTTHDKGAVTTIDQRWR